MMDIGILWIRTSSVTTFAINMTLRTTFHFLLCGCVKLPMLIVDSVVDTFWSWSTFSPYNLVLILRWQDIGTFARAFSRHRRKKECGVSVVEVYQGSRYF